MGFCAGLRSRDANMMTMRPMLRFTTLGFESGSFFSVHMVFRAHLEGSQGL